MSKARGLGAGHLKGGSKRGLGSSPLGSGRGINALIPRDDQGRGQLLEVALGQIEPHPEQPRKRFNPNALEELARSIQAQGVIQPIIVTPLKVSAEGSSSLLNPPTRYLIIAGERRWRAAKIAGLTQVPVISRELSEQSSFEIALLENLQRVDLTPLEEALAYRRLIDEFDLSHEEVARRTGKSRAAISNTLRLLKLPPDIAELIDSGALSAGHGRALLALSEVTDQSAFATRVHAEGWSVRELERRVRAHLEGPQVTVDDVSNTETEDDEKDEWISRFITRAQDTLYHRVNPAMSTHLALQVSAHPRGGVQLKIQIDDEEAAHELLALLSTRDES